MTRRDTSGRNEVAIHDGCPVCLKRADKIEFALAWAEIRVPCALGDACSKPLCCSLPDANIGASASASATWATWAIAVLLETRELHGAVACIRLGGGREPWQRFPVFCRRTLSAVSTRRMRQLQQPLNLG